ncbi:MAG: hypothetical protein LBT59_10755, partial [Clostridiales bacterium]|nr:hypothetical protein [Clostridiales bacterium]
MFRIIPDDEFAFRNILLSSINFINNRNDRKRTPNAERAKLSQIQLKLRAIKINKKNPALLERDLSHQTIFKVSMLDV